MNVGRASSMASVAQRKGLVPSERTRLVHRSARVERGLEKRSFLNSVEPKEQVPSFFQLLMGFVSNETGDSVNFAGV